MSNSELKGTLVQHMDTQSCDVVFYDSSANAFLYYRLDGGKDKIPKTCVPIGLVAIPASTNYYENYACGVISLNYMSCTNTSGVKEKELMMWGNDIVLTNANNLQNGKINTQKIIETRGVLEESPDANNPSHYPAASACYNYVTAGTNKGDWYLPSLDELDEFFINQTGDLDNVLKQLNTVYSKYNIGDFVLKDIWSSVENTEKYANYLLMVALEDYADKTSQKGVIAFTQLGALQRNYGDIFISGGVVSDISAAGGETQVTNYTYSQTYGYGDSTTNGGTITSGADIEVISVSADTLSTTEKERTKIGDSVLIVTMNGKTASKSYEAYQEANVKTATGTSGGDISYGNVTAGSITNGWVGAGGGTGTGYAGNGSQSWSKSAITTYYSYTSGATSSAITTAASSGTNSIAPSRSSYSVSPGSRGTTTGDVLTWSASVTWSGSAGKSASGTIYVQQAANQVTSTSWYNGNAGGWIQKRVVNKTSNVTVLGGEGISKNKLVVSIPKSASGGIDIETLCVGTSYYSSGASKTVYVEAYSVELDDGEAYEVGTTIRGEYPLFGLTFLPCTNYNLFNNSFIKIGVSFGSSLYKEYVIEVQRPN